MDQVPVCRSVLSIVRYQYTHRCAGFALVGLLALADTPHRQSGTRNPVPHRSSRSPYEEALSPVMLRSMVMVVLLKVVSRARAQEPSCDWGLLGRKIEAVTDACCFDATTQGSSQPPLGNAARIRQEFDGVLPMLSFSSVDTGISYCEAYGGEDCAEWYMLASLQGPWADRYGIPADSQCMFDSYQGLAGAVSNCDVLLGGADDIHGSCAHMYPACAQCATSCKEAVVQECLSECDEYFERKGQATAEGLPLDQTQQFDAVGNAIIAACLDQNAGCDGACITDLGNYSLCRAHGTSRQACENPDGEFMTMYQGLDDDAGRLFGECWGDQMEVMVRDREGGGGSACRTANVVCEPEDMPGELLCTEMSCDATCDMHMQALLGSCQVVLDALFDTGDGSADGVATKFSDLSTMCPSMQNGAPEADSLVSRGRLARDKCAEFALVGTIDGVVPDTPPLVCDGNGYGICINVVDNMLSVAAALAGTPLANEQPWLKVCQPNGLLQACSQIYDEIQNLELPQTECAIGEPGTSIDGITCLEAPNLNWKEAVLPPGATWEDSTRGTWIGNQVLKCAYDPENSPVAASGVEACPVAESTWPGSDSNACAVALLIGDPDQDTITCADIGCVYDPETPWNCVQGPGPLPATNQDRTGWADVIANYTSKRGPQFRQQLATCEAALAAHTQPGYDGECPDDVPSPNIGTFFANCGACQGFSFTSGDSSSACLNYFVGYMDWLVNIGVRIPIGTPPREACLAQFRGSGPAQEVAPEAVVRDHVEFFVARAHDAQQHSAGGSFCDFTPPASVDYFMRGLPPPRMSSAQDATEAPCTPDSEDLCRFDRAGNGNGRVDTADLLLLLATFGVEC